MRADAFNELYNAYSNAVKRHLTVFTLLRVVHGDEDVMDAGNKVAGKLRYSDYLGLAEDGRLYILLTNTDIENAEFVRKRLASIGYETEVMMEAGE